MLKVFRKANHGTSDYRWIKMVHHFSFGEYYDKSKRGIGHLRALNITEIVAGAGYDMHHHRDLEAVSYVYQGTLLHTSAQKTTAVTAPAVQYIGAGTGTEHQEASTKEEHVKLVEIWFDPEKHHLTPNYNVQPIVFNHPENKLVRIASPDRGDGLVHIRQDASVFVLTIDESQYRSFSLKGQSEMYLVQLEGESYINSHHVFPGDALHATETIHIQPILKSHFVIIEIT